MLNFQTQLAWLVTMAQCPGFKAYAWQRAQELDALWPGISDALKAAMTGPAKASASVGQSPTKPH